MCVRWRLSLVVWFCPFVECGTPRSELPDRTRSGVSYLNWFELCGRDVVRTVGEDLGPASVVRDVVVRLIHHCSSDVYVVGVASHTDGLVAYGRPIFPLIEVIKAFAMCDAPETLPNQR